MAFLLSSLTSFSFLTNSSITKKPSISSSSQITSYGEKCTERDILSFEAKLAEAAERFDEMFELMTQLVKIRETDGVELSADERQSLLIAFKQAISPRRSAFRQLSGPVVGNDSEDDDVHKNSGNNNNRKPMNHAAFFKKIQPRGSGTAPILTVPQVDNCIQYYRKEIELEVRNTCLRFYKLVDDILIPMSTDGEVRVFYYKTEGDCLRYLAECSEGIQQHRAIEGAREAYQNGMNTAKKELKVTHPTRLGLALNWSVYHQDVLHETKTAILIAKEAFNDAIDEIDDLSDESYKDTTMVLQMLRDTINKWHGDVNENIFGL